MMILIRKAKQGNYLFLVEGAVGEEDVFASVECLSYWACLLDDVSQSARPGASSGVVYTSAAQALHRLACLYNSIDLEGATSNL